MQTGSDLKSRLQWSLAVLLWLVAVLIVLVAVVFTGIVGFIAATTAFGLGKYGAPSEWPRSGS